MIYKSQNCQITIRLVVRDSLVKKHSSLSVTNGKSFMTLAQGQGARTQEPPDHPPARSAYFRSPPVRPEPQEGEGDGAADQGQVQNYFSSSLLIK